MDAPEVTVGERGAQEAPVVDIGAEGAKWGNRISLAPILSVAVLAVIDAVLEVLSVVVWPSTVLLVAYGIVFIVLVALLGVLLAVRRAFSFAGGRAEGMLDAHLLSSCVDMASVSVSCADADVVNVLDVGCSTGALSIMCAKSDPRVRVTGVDAFGSESALETARGNARLEGVESQCEFADGDISALDFADGTFDVVISSLAYDAAPLGDRPALATESLRVLREGGAFAFMSNFGSGQSAGEPPTIVSELSDEGLAEVSYEAGIAESEWLPASALGKLTMRNTGVLHGVK